MARNVKVVASVLVVGLVLGAGVTAALGPAFGGDDADPVPSDEPTVADGLSTFENESEYRDYVQASTGYQGASMGAAGGNGAARTDVAEAAQPTAVADSGSASASSSTGSDATRVGGTNVQEQGIDEPDLVTTVGQHFVYAPEKRPQVYPSEPVDRVPEMSDDNPRFQKSPSYVVDASEPASPELVERFNESGKLLRSGDTLVVLGSHNVTGYDVTDPKNPTKTWSKALNSSIRTARMNDGQLYVVTATNANRACPIRPMGDAEIACTQIYRPQVGIDADATFTAYSIEPGSGDVADSTSFVGTAHSTVVYMSDDGLYVTYTKNTPRGELMTDYLVEEAEMVPDRVTERLREIDAYDISATSKQREMQRAVRNWLDSLSEAERRAAQESLSNGIRSYATERQRELTRTGIVRIGVGDGDLSVDATGTVAGRPLNQFSMDQHDGTLRIATTIPEVYGAKSENDLYTLDADNLEQLGAETGMGVDERIYSVRYVGDTAYMVTFRQIDPFHVVDLSDPSNPTELGNVELPGYSDYLHPVGEDTIMGIGEEDGQVKAVLFDVSDPANPTVADSKILDAHWSAVSGTHHAFMQDSRHGVAFLPTGESAIVLDYTNQTLGVERKITLDSAPERARYVGDYLYVFSPSEIQVLDETTWDVTATLPLGA